MLLCAVVTTLDGFDTQSSRGGIASASAVTSVVVAMVTLRARLVLPAPRIWHGLLGIRSSTTAVPMTVRSSW